VVTSLYQRIRQRHIFTEKGQTEQQAFFTEVRKLAQFSERSASLKGLNQSNVHKLK